MIKTKSHNVIFKSFKLQPQIIQQPKSHEKLNSRGKKLRWQKLSLKKKYFKAVYGILQQDNIECKTLLKDQI